MGPALSLLLAAGQEIAPGGLLESLEKDVVRVVDRLRPCVATVDVDRPFPLPPLSLSAFLLDTEGTVVTAGAALEGAHRISVRFVGGRSYRGELVGRGPENRVGVLRIPATNLPEPPLAESATLRPGSLVVGIGSPYGFQASVFLGCVSGSDRSLGGMRGLVQTTVPVNHGNAGGALANARGEIVAMLVGPYERSRVLAIRMPPTAPEAEKAPGKKRLPTRREEADEEDEAESRRGEVVVRTEDLAGAIPSEGIHFALPIACVREDARSVLERTGSAHGPSERRRWLGVYLEPSIDPALASHLGLEEGRGVLVREVYAESPAAQADLRPHDILVSLDGSPLEAGAESLRRRLDAKPAGSRVEFEIVRRGQPVRLAVKLE
ncbi:MAG: S1C family serine protease [Planctomycetes bacterium]|nr:S1C family serine protease [Planctomycetota bacterium]